MKKVFLFLSIFLISLPSKSALQTETYLKEDLINEVETFLQSDESEHVNQYAFFDAIFKFFGITGKAIKKGIERKIECGETDVEMCPPDWDGPDYSDEDFR